MYIKSGLRSTVLNFDTLLTSSKNVAKKNNANRFLIIIDELYCLFFWGVIFTEYQACDYYNRSRENRKTFITVLSLLRVLKKYNPEKYRSLFHDKIQFNTLFNDFIGRKWITDKESDETIINFIKENNKVVLKNSGGCSGKQVYVSKEDDTVDSILEKFRKEHYNLMEQTISNCPQIKSLNPTSLNTLRIVTVRAGKYFKVICACIRIGAKNARLDNVSMGGGAARINIETGKIDSFFVSNSFRDNDSSASQNGRDEIGFQVPYWKEAIGILEKASLIVPEIHIVGWDVAITETGPYIIEGNESFHTDVMQFYANTAEPGLKQVFDEAVTHIS